MSYLNRTLPYVNAFGTVDISDCTSIEEALNRAELNYTIEKRPVFDANGNEIPGFVTTNRTDTDEVMGMVTPSYEPLQNLRAFNFLDDLADDGMTFKSAGSYKGGSGIWVMGELPEESILGDAVSNNIIFTNSHNGTSGVKVMMTPTRVICSNMLNIAMKRAQRVWRTKHTRNIEFRMGEARNTLQLAEKYMKALSEEAERLSEIRVDENMIDNILDQMFPVNPDKMSDRKIENISAFKNDFFICYHEDDIKQFKGTAWGALMAMTDMASHRAPNRMTENYYNNAWDRLITGNKNVDNFYGALA